jgi:tRNA threonylcarbamoyladenosine biosynthesis protein TsaB
MNILALDTCFSACSVAVGKTGEGTGTAFYHEFELRQTGQAEVLMPMVERVMREAGQSFSALDRIAVTTGPGSFTGMRIGIAAARAIGVTLGIPVIGVPTLQVMAADLDIEGPVMIAVEARKDQVYVQLFGGNRKPVTDAQVLSYADAAVLAKSATVCGSGAGALALLNAALKTAHQDLQPNAVAVAKLAIGLDQSTEARPLYLRPPDAKPQDGKSLQRAS